MLHLPLTVQLFGITLPAQCAATPPHELQVVRVRLKWRVSSLCENFVRWGIVGLTHNPSTCRTTLCGVSANAYWAGKVTATFHIWRPSVPTV